MGRTLSKLLFFGFIIAVLGGTVWWANSLILVRQVQVVTAQSGSLQVPLMVQAWVANSEQVVTSPAAGQLQKLVPDGERVRIGTLIAKVVDPSLNTVNDELTAPSSGLVSYNVDGLEGVFTPKNITQWDPAKFTGLMPKVTTSGTVQSGQGVFKIVDNLSPTYLLFTLPKSQPTLKNKDWVMLEMDGQKVYGRVAKLEPTTQGTNIVVGLSEFLNQSLGRRTVQIGWLDMNPPQGEIIPTSAIKKEQGQQGVFVVNDGVVAWHPVQILNQGPDKVCVKGLNPGDAVIATPDYVHVGEVLPANS